MAKTIYEGSAHPDDPVYREKSTVTFIANSTPEPDTQKPDVQEPDAQEPETSVEATTPPESKG